MAYLVGHMALSLAFAQLLGLLLGWLVWGYAARQRSQEVRSLRMLLAEVPVAMPRVAGGDVHGSLAGTPPEAENADSLQAPSLFSSPTEESDAPGDGVPLHIPADNGPRSRGKSLLRDDLPGAGTVKGSFFLASSDRSFRTAILTRDQPEPASARAQVTTVDMELELEVKQSHIRHLEQQLHDLLPLRERLPKIEAELTEVRTKKAAVDEEMDRVHKDFDLRIDSLLGQITTFEEAAREWDHQREQFEREAIAKDKELAAAHGRVRDLQNSQLPQKAEQAQADTAQQLRDLRDKHQKLQRERDSLAADLVTAKKLASNKGNSGARLSDLEDALRVKDQNLSDQVSRVEALLWRVAELEPFAVEAPKLQDSMSRLESEISGHLALHGENAEQLETLRKRIAELEQDIQTKVEKKAAEMASYQAAVQDQARQLAELKAAHESTVKQSAQFEENLAAREDVIRNIEAHLAAMNAEAKLAHDLLNEKEAAILSLSAKSDELQQELHTLRQHDLPMLAEQLNSAQFYITELEPKAHRLTEVERRLTEVETNYQTRLQNLTAQHQQEVTRLRMNSAHSVRRLRQSLLS